MGFYVMLSLSLLSLCVMHWTRVVWVTSKRQLLSKIPDFNDPYLGFLDAIFLVIFAYAMLFSTSRLNKFTHRTCLLVVNFFIQGVLMILMGLIMIVDLPALILLPLVFFILPISQALCYGIILINMQRIFDGCCKSLRFLNFIMSLWHSIASFGHIIGYSLGLLLTRGTFQLSASERYTIHLFLVGGFLFFIAILLAFFHREDDLALNIYRSPNECLNQSPDVSQNTSNLNLSPNISSLLSIEKPLKDNNNLDISNYSRFSRESSINMKPQYFSQKKNNTEYESSWVFKNIMKNSLCFSGVKTFYWGLLFWGAYFLNLKNTLGEVWLGDTCMILYETGQVIIAFLLSIKRMEYTKTLMLYPVAFLFASVGLLFLFITDPNHLIYYMVFLIIGGFLGMVFITIGDIMCESLINDADLRVSFHEIRKTALGIDYIGNFIIGILVFLMNFMFDWFMVWLCGLAVVLLLYWGTVCCFEYRKKDRNSERSSGNINSSTL